ncbi:MAG: hypothetical protein JW944_01770, partial [Deltaproteobacteria bacterium]|nr:hypothetical protein [Deltaproteobacteria bacterium]
GGGDMSGYIKRTIRFILQSFVVCVGITAIIASGNGDGGGYNTGDGDGDSDDTIIEDDRFITTWDTRSTSFNQDGEEWSSESGSDQLKLPLDTGGIYNFEVAWGDGSTDHITLYNQEEIIHTYSSGGAYDVTITGTIEGFGFGFPDEPDPPRTEGLKLIDVKNWGDVKLHNKGYQFYDSK